ncbi:hypothetical protein EZV62_020127 [Acer yangbiense]|uniref:Transcription and mRNA export factor ENY2 n=1 Tax=Acer yangbiense TaxID=1000413 RepID=A0A5C7HD36_9ROSI|nr:hypothetical protein EZV62_020127 [Acer yangbiense]
MRNSVNRPPTPDAVEEQEKEHSLQEIINIKLIESGEKERLMELLRERLVECGWKDEMKALSRTRRELELVADELSQLLNTICFLWMYTAWAFIKKKGRNNVTVDDLIHVITPKGRASIPGSIKAELLQRIRTFLASAAL